MSDTEIHDRLVEVANQSVPTDLLPRVREGVLRRRRRRGAVTIASSIAAVVAIALIGTQADGSHTARPPSRAAVQKRQHPVSDGSSAHKTRSTKHHVVKAPAVKLVAYTGKQPAGYAVDKVPAGWVLGGVNAFALTVGPAGDPNTDPADFVGKLVVSLQPPGDTLRTDEPKHGGLRVSVAGRAGLFIGPEAGGGGPDSVLSFFDARGNVVDVLIPPELGWTTPGPAVAFAEGVHVLGSAQPSYG